MGRSALDRAPSISGDPRRGTPLRTEDGTWLNQPDSYTRTWQRLAKGRWVTVSGGATASYAPSTLDLGHRLRFVVVAENANGTVASTSAATAPTAAVAITRATSRKHKSRRR